MADDKGTREPVLLEDGSSEDTKDESDDSGAATTVRAKGDPIELEDAPPELNPNVFPGPVRPDLAPGGNARPGGPEDVRRDVIDKQLTSLTDMDQGLNDALTGKTIGRHNGPGVDEMLNRAGQHGLGKSGKEGFGLPDRHTNDDAPPMRTPGHDPTVASGLPEYVPPKDAQEKTDKLNKESQDKRDASEKFKKDKAEFEKRQYEEPKPKEYDDGESGPVPSWVPDGTGGPPVSKGDWVSKPINPDLGGGDDGGDRTVDPSKVRVGGVAPGVIDKDPDYQEYVPPSEPPAGKRGDVVSKPVNPDDIDPGLPPSTGPAPGTGPAPRGGGDTEGPPLKGPMPGGDPDTDAVPVAAVAEPAPAPVAHGAQDAPPPVVTQEAPPPVVAQDAPQLAVHDDDFSDQPVGVGVGAGEPGAPAPDDDGDGIPN